MFDLNVSGLEIVARTAIVYFVLLGMLRLAGKRQIGQITPFDLVLILLISNAVQNAMVGPDVSVTGGLIAAAVLILGNYLVAEARTHFPWLRFAVEGTPTLLIQDGQILAGAGVGKPQPGQRRRDGQVEATADWYRHGSGPG